MFQNMFFQRNIIILTICLASVAENVAFQTEINDTEVLRKWRTVDTSMRSILTEVLHQALPVLFRSISETDISINCSTSLVSAAIGLTQLKEFPMKLLDASGKFSTGLLVGSRGDWGDYDECVNVAETDDQTNEVRTRGKYCELEVRLPLPPKPTRIRTNIPLEIFRNFSLDNHFLDSFKYYAHVNYVGGLKFGICVPSTCQKEDIQNVLSYVITEKIGLPVDVNSCEILKDTNISPLQYSLIIIAGLFISLCVLGTAFDVLQKFTVKTPEQNDRKILAVFRLLRSFSVVRTVGQVMIVDSTNSGELRCIHGIRFLTMSWVILCHTYLFQMISSENKNTVIGLSWLKDAAFQVMVNGGVSMETFFCIGGLVTGYMAVRVKFKAGMYKYIPLLLLRRIYRLYPSMLLIIGVAFVMPLLGSGPRWKSTVETVSNRCQATWFYNLLFVNNFLNIDRTACWPHLWYLAVDTQLHLLAVISLIIYFKKPAWAIVLNILLIVASVIYTSLITYWKNFEATLGPVTIDKDEVEELAFFVHTMPLTHMASYFIGLAFGIYIGNRRKSQLRLIVQIVGWCVASGLSLASLYGNYTWNQSQKSISTESIIYSGLHRVCWTLGVVWVIFACVTGHGGVVDTILSWPFFIPLSRLTYMVYLFHPVVIYYYVGSRRNMFYLNHNSLIWLFFGNLVISYIVSFIAHILYDGPLSLIGQLMFGNAKEALAKLQVEEPSTDGPTIFTVNKNIKKNFQSKPTLEGSYVLKVL